MSRGAEAADADVDDATSILQSLTAVGFEPMTPLAQLVDDRDAGRGGPAMWF